MPMEQGLRHEHGRPAVSAGPRQPAGARAFGRHRADPAPRLPALPAPHVLRGPRLCLAPALVLHHHDPGFRADVGANPRGPDPRRPDRSGHVAHGDHAVHHRGHSAAHGTIAHHRGRGGPARRRLHGSRPQPDDRFRALHHGLADACRGHRQAAARQAHCLVDRADHRHQRLLDQLRHRHGLRRSRRLHRRAHGCRHDAAGGRHADHAHVERPEEGPQSGGRHPVLDFLWLLHRGCGDAVRRRPQRHHHQLLEGLLLQSAGSGNAPLPDGLRHLDHLRLPDVPAPPAHRGGTADLHVQAGSHGHVPGHQPVADAGLDAGSHARQSNG